MLAASKGLCFALLLSVFAAVDGRTPAVYKGGVHSFYGGSLVSGAMVAGTSHIASLAMKRHLTETFLQSIKQLWSEWQLRLMVSASLLFQILLILFGSRRKHNPKAWVGIVVWLAYLSADLVATAALGAISNSSNDHKDYLLQTLWAPFLLLHLGGPDTITAFSLEDNELWLRHLLDIVLQVGVASSILLLLWRSGSGTLIRFLPIPVFVAGVAKYGERTWALWAASMSHCRSSLLPPPDPGPDYAEFMEKLALSRHGVSATLEGVYWDFVKEGIAEDAKFLHEAHKLFKTLRQLYAGYILDRNQINIGICILRDKSPQQVFRIIEVELNLMYDVLYTKAPAVYSLPGCVLRIVSFLCILSTCIVFWVLVDKQPYSEIDLLITYFLILGGVILETFGLVSLMFSDWTMLWLTEFRKPLPDSVFHFLSPFWRRFSDKKRWCDSVSQHNLLDICLDDSREFGKFEQMLKLIGVYDTLKSFARNSRQTVTPEMKDTIGRYLRVRPAEAEYHDKRGDYVLERYGCKDEFLWSTKEVDFDHSILLWHIATDLCYKSDLSRLQDSNKEMMLPYAESSRLLSNYMSYLLVMRPFMLPEGIGETRYRDTCAEATRFFKQRKAWAGIDPSTEARMMLLQVNTDGFKPLEVKGDRSKALLFSGVILAKQLKALEMEEDWDEARKWEMVSEVWVEMLAYGAAECGMKQHMQQLRKGGELITLVRLFMAHNGQSERFQIRTGAMRVRVVSSPSESGGEDEKESGGEDDEDQDGEDDEDGEDDQDGEDDEDGEDDDWLTE